jgi:hypothetical protein
MPQVIVPPATGADAPSSRQTRKLEPVIRRVLILAILFGQIAFHFSRPNVYLDPDIWWHLATGRWILQNDSIPVTDPFSRFGQDRPWVEYSWLFDVLVFKAYRSAGLGGIELVKTTTVALLALVLYLLLHRLAGSFGSAVLLTATVLWACLPLATPRPWLFTIFLFILELAVLTRLRNGSGKKLALALPAIFALWANLHVQFIYGLVLIGFFLLEGLQARFLQQSENYRGTWNSAGLYGTLLVACAGAACLNPYGLGLYRTVWDYANQGSIYLLIQDLSPPNFRSPTHWLFLGLVLGAAYVLGRRRVTSVLPYLLLGFGLFCGLRMQRDVWLGAVAGAVVLASWPSGRKLEQLDPEWSPKVGVTSLIAFASLVMVLWGFGTPETELKREVSKHYPVDAVRYISSHSLGMPIFNDFGWGGYLAWALPSVKVSIDGRTNVHPPDRIMTSYRTWSGRPEWSSDRELKEARVVLAPRNQPLVSILRLQPGYQLAYQDDLAVVFSKPDGQ